MKRYTPMLLATLALSLACDQGPRTELDPVVAGADALDGSDESDDTTAAEDDEDFSEESFDVPPPVDFSCTKIDFLFVIDDSGSMGDEQERLIDGFPGFLASVESAIAQYDYHMMVVTTGYRPPVGENYSCDETIGAGRIATGDGTECGMFEAEVEGEPTKRYADAETTDEDALTDLFSCVADVGVKGSGAELPVWAMAQALTAHTKPGGCNAGFLRDDAILVVTIITDEEDDAMSDSPGDPALWKDVILSAKHGRESDIVMLGLVGDTDLEDGVCDPYDLEAGSGAEGAPRLRELIDSFEYGSWASVCKDDYTPFFTDAVDDIGRACQDFVPAG